MTAAIIEERLASLDKLKLGMVHSRTFSRVDWIRYRVH